MTPTSAAAVVGAVAAALAVAVSTAGATAWRPAARTPLDDSDGDGDGDGDGGEVDSEVPAARRRRRAPRLLRRGALGASALVVLLVGGPMGLLAVAAIVVAGRAVAPVRRARRTRRAVEAAMPDTIELLVHAIRAGLSPLDAIRHLATGAPPAVAPAFGAVVHRTERDQTLPDALRALPELLGPSAAGVTDALAAGVRYGLPLAPLLDQLGVEARDARRRRAEASARRLPVRMSFPLVVCTLPSFVLLAIAPAVIAALSSLAGPAW